VELPQIPFLQTLYDLVLERSEKRMPKWKFRLAADLVMEIQPKLTRAGRRYEVTALQVEEADAAKLIQRRVELAGTYIRLRGAITDTCERGCWLKFTHVGWSRRHDDPAARRGLRERVVAAFTEGRFNRFDPAILLTSHCMICGKALTDPVSQARCVGPECANTGSVRIPWIVDVTMATSAL
jgi:Family of unknown function (DUF6011)